MALQGGIFRLLILGNRVDWANRNADQTNGRNELAIWMNSKQKNGVAANEVYRVAGESDLILLFASAGRSKPENNE